MTSVRDTSRTRKTRSRPLPHWPPSLPSPYSFDFFRLFDCTHGVARGDRAGSGDPRCPLRGWVRLARVRDRQPTARYRRGCSEGWFPAGRSPVRGRRSERSQASRPLTSVTTWPSRSSCSTSHSTVSASGDHADASWTLAALRWQGAGLLTAPSHPTRALRPVRPSHRPPAPQTPPAAGEHTMKRAQRSRDGPIAVALAERDRIGESSIRQKDVTGAPIRSDPKLGNAYACRPSSKAATDSSSAAVTTPWPPRPWIRISTTGANLRPSPDPVSRDNYAIDCAALPDAQTVAFWPSTDRATHLHERGSSWRTTTRSCAARSARCSRPRANSRSSPRPATSTRRCARCLRTSRT